MKGRLSAYYFLFFLAVGSSGPFLTLLLHARGLSTSNIGLILAAGALGGSIVQPFIGHLNDRLGRPRGLLFGAAILSPVLFFGYKATSGFILFLIISVLASIVQGAFPIADAVAINQSRHQAFTYGQVRLWGAAGYAVMVAAAGWFYDHHGYEAAVYAYAALTLPLLVVIALLPGRIAEPQASALRRPRVWDLLRQPQLMAFIAISFVVTIAITINSSFLPLYYADLHYPLAWVGLNFTVAAAVEIPCFYLSGRLITRFGQMQTVVIGTAIYAAKYAIMAWAPKASIVIAAQALDGIAYALFWSASVDMVNRLAPTGRTSSAQSLYSALAGSLSGIIATATGGWVLGNFGPRILYAAMTLATALMILPFVGLAKAVSHSRSSRGPGLD